MKLPLSWLREYVDVDASAQDIADRLTFSGTEVEGMETVGSDYAGIVVGEVVAVEPHPRADRLKICRVNDGRQILQVVCGAPDVKVGDKAPFAGIGVTLPGGMRIREAKLRGEASYGMLCAEDELGVSDNHGGLMALPPESAAGAPLAAVLGPPETVLNVEITWNRPDCLSIIGMAREVAALFGLPLRRPAPVVKEGGEAAEHAIAVSIEAPRDCLRYTARVIRGVVPGPSPAWMQKRLTLCGVRPINALVDVTNYVMLECGQPLHAFDHALLRGQRIVVRRASVGEPFATLDGVTRALESDMLVIADAERAVALAGVMGGAGSEIGESTRTVLLESAAFAPPGIHRTSTRLGLVTESSRRFERGVDVGGTDWAADRAAALMAELAGGTVAPGLVDVYPGRAAARRVSVRFARVHRLLGVDVSPDEVVATLDALQLPVVERGPDQCTVTVPTFRHDLELEADLVEEVARLVGLERIPEAPASSRVVSGASEAPFQAESACRAALVGLGLAETLNYSFLGPHLLDLFTPSQTARRVALPNPVSADYSVMRDALAPQMVETLGRNLSRQVRDVRCFEMGRVFLRDAAGAIHEEDRVCIGLMGAAGRHPTDLRRPVEAGEMFLWTKGVVEGVLAAMRAGEASFRPAACEWMEPGAAVEVVVGGHAVGLLGLVSRAVRREWRMQGPVGVAELSARAIAAGAFRPVELGPVPAYPAIVRDVAMVVDEAVSHADVVRVVRASAPSELTRIDLFDIFRSEGLAHGRKSVAYAFEFRSLTRSLTDEEANGFRDAIRDALVRELNAEMRE